MKKVLAVLLVCTMVLSGLVLPTFAEEPAVKLKQEITLSNCDISVPGWNWSPDLELQGKDGKIGSVSKTFAAGEESAPIAALIIQYKSPKDVDISAYTKVRFDLYVSDIDVLLDTQFTFELTSAGTCDKEENQQHDALNSFLVGEPVDGWNTFEAGLGSGGLKTAEWDFMRMFNDGSSFTTGDEDLVVAFDNLRFANDAGEELMISNCDPLLPGWNSAATPVVYKAVDPDNKEDKDRSYITVTPKGVVGPAGGFMLNFNYSEAKKDEKNDEDKVINATGKKFLRFDLYVSDIEAAKNKTFCFELNSSGGRNDDAEYQTNAKIGDLVDEFTNGWHTVYLPIAEFASAKNGAPDITKINFLAIFNCDNPAVDYGDGITFGFDNIVLTDGLGVPSDGFEHETQTVDVATADDNTLIVKGHNHDAFYYNDTDSSTVLKFTVANAATAGATRFIAKTAAQLALSVSMDNAKWTPVYSAGEFQLTDMYRVYDLTEYVDYSVSDTVYVKIADSTPADGNGGRIYKGAQTILDVLYEVPEEGSNNPHYTLVSACDTEAGFDQSVSIKPVADTEFKTQGKGSLKIAKADAFGGGTVILCFKAANTRNKSFDLTNVWAEGGLVFDVYAPTEEDAATLNALKLSIELTSKGTSDQEELAYNNKSLGDNVEGGMKQGWNEVVLPFKNFNAPTNGDLNKAAWNFLRAHVVGGEATNGVTFYIDNLRIWDGNDGSVDDEYTFTVFGEDEAQYLFEDAATKNDGCRYTDNNGYVIYKFDVKNIYNVKSVKFNAKVGQQLGLDISLDGVEWTNVYKFEGPLSKESDGKPIAVDTFDLTPFINVDVPDFETIYLKIYDTFPENGWGGAIYKDAPAKLIVNYIPPITSEDKNAIEMTPTKHKVPIIGCDVVWSNNQEENIFLDKEDYVAGASCVKFGYVNDLQTLSYAFKDDPIDATGMDTLEFDFYISCEDLIKVSYPGGSSVELCCGGTCDVGEYAWDFGSIFTSIEGGAKVGWNHVVLPISAAHYTDTSGKIKEFDYSNINYMRLFYLQPETEVEGGYFKIDNFVMTDLQARKKDLARPEAMKVIAQIEALGAKYEAAGSQITKENVEEFRALYEAANAAKKALSAEGQSWITTTTNKILTGINSAIKAYDKAAKEEQDKPDDPGKDDPTDPGKDDPTDPGKDDPTDPGKDDPGEPTDDGCKSVVATGIGFMLVASFAAAAFVFKKKED